MLIPILKPEEKIIYGACQYLKDKYKDGNIVGVYAAYCIDNQWVYHYGKTSLKDGKVETIDNYIIYDMYGYWILCVKIKRKIQYFKQ